VQVEAMGGFVPGAVAVDPDPGSGDETEDAW